MLHYCCDGLTDHFKNPFFSFTSYASAVLGPPDGLEALGASAGASEGLGADADSLGASELDEEELEAASASGATATAARRITISARARAIVVGAICTFAVPLLLWCSRLVAAVVVVVVADSSGFIRERRWLFLDLVCLEMRCVGVSLAVAHVAALAQWGAAYF